MQKEGKNLWTERIHHHLLSKLISQQLITKSKRLNLQNQMQGQEENPRIKIHQRTKEMHRRKAKMKRETKETHQRKGKTKQKQTNLTSRTQTKEKNLQVTRNKETKLRTPTKVTLRVAIKQPPTKMQIPKKKANNSKQRTLRAAIKQILTETPLQRHPLQVTQPHKRLRTRNMKEIAKTSKNKKLVQQMKQSGLRNRTRKEMRTQNTYQTEETKQDYTRNR
mmetsp:Transcript_1254/g.1595  ORF Transcript_1254/g.1595 Transcript_1254/m.1595 type:complete len:221 (+) Transcript_1254:500-1162(+)